MYSRVRVKPKVPKGSLTNFFFNICAFISQLKEGIPEQFIACKKKKIPTEYQNNKILLMTLNTRFCSWFFQVTKSSLTNFCCYNIQAFISL